MTLHQVCGYDLKTYYILYAYKYLPTEQEIKQETLWKFNYLNKISQLAKNPSQEQSLESGRLGTTGDMIIFIVQSKHFYFRCRLCSNLDLLTCLQIWKTAKNWNGEGREARKEDGKKQEKDEWWVNTRRNSWDIPCDGEVCSLNTLSLLHLQTWFLFLFLFFILSSFLPENLPAQEWLIIQHSCNQAPSGPEMRSVCMRKGQGDSCHGVSMMLRRPRQLKTNPWHSSFRHSHPLLVNFFYVYETIWDEMGSKLSSSLQATLMSQCTQSPVDLSRYLFDKRTSKATKLHG